MKLPENMATIKDVTYKGPRDDEGHPHGYGTMEYSTATFKKYRYEGYFVNGKRDGYGVWNELHKIKNDIDRYSWYSTGEYDSAGRLIHPEHESGSYEEFTPVWYEEFRGWWKNDEPVHDLKYKKASETEFELTEDYVFLSHFVDLRDVRKLTPQMVSKMFQSKNPYARYGYGVWLWATHMDEESLKTAFRIFQEAAQEGIADALQMMSRMYYTGEAYDDKEGRFVMDRRLSEELNGRAIRNGSLFARLRRNRDLFYGTTNVKADRYAAITEAKYEASLPGASIFWTEHLGWFYQDIYMQEKAMEAYEKCILNGYYSPICDLALLYLENDEVEYYEVLMQAGIDMEVSDCLVLGSEREPQWEELEDDERLALHRQLENNLLKGVAMGNAYCAYILAEYHFNGKMGFDFDWQKGREYADKGFTFGNYGCITLIIETAETLNDPEFISDDELLKLRMHALKYGLDSQLDYVIDHKDTYYEMGYGRDIESIWLPFWKKRHPEAKTQISPSVIIIQPSGDVSVIEADVFAMSYREMRLLIDAEGLDAVHFSEPLKMITEKCGLKKYQVAMYADRDGIARNLPDNAIATMLYGSAAEIRGAVIIALEDNRYDTHSFHFQEDIDDVLAEISMLAGGLLKIS